VPYEKALACLAASISAASPSTISMHGESITSALVTTLSTGHTWQGIYCLLAQLIHCQVGFIWANTEWVECLLFAKFKTTFFPIFLFMCSQAVGFVSCWCSPQEAAWRWSFRSLKSFNWINYSMALHSNWCCLFYISTGYSGDFFLH
jgi:hypothetical protein